jgi:formamidopyrimidine-DNA glycosylase
MPELPDVEAYLAALRPRILGARLERVRLASSFVLRSVEPPLTAASGHAVTDLRRLGKRLVIALEGELYLILHLMIAGRLHWRSAGARTPGKVGLAAFDFSTGTLVLTEAGTKRRASLHLVRGEDALDEHDPGGLDVLAADLAAFGAALQAESHTLKRVLTDPRVFSGIGNAYSDEILHAARLSPVRLSRQLDAAEIARLFEATRRTLTEWTARLSRDVAEHFPEHVTAFREEMAVHGRFGRPCPVCGAPVQRIVHAENEVNYCARCQTGGRLLADRALSRLLKADWPRTLEEMEERRASLNPSPSPGRGRGGGRR